MGLLIKLDSLSEDGGKRYGECFSVNVIRGLDSTCKIVS